MAAALREVPARRARGWCGLHFELAAGATSGALHAAERLLAEESTTWSWLEAARAAYSASLVELGRRRMLFGSLLAGLTTARASLAAPRLEPAKTLLLDPEENPLPLFEGAVVDLLDDALELELPGDPVAWIPALGSLERVLMPGDLAWPAGAAATGFDVGSPAPAGEAAPRSFLRALVAAREARTRESSSYAAVGSDELRARTAMKRIAPQLFQRYLERLGMLG